MTDAYFDDENFKDGFDEDSFNTGMDIHLWRKLLSYALHYRKEVIILASCAFCTAVAEIAFPLITKAVIDAVAADGEEDERVEEGRLDQLDEVLARLVVRQELVEGAPLVDPAARADVRLASLARVERR